MLTLAFDTATDVATVALVRDGDVLGERASRAVRVLEDVEAILGEAGLRSADVEGLVVGTGPGSYTGLRPAFTRPTPVVGPTPHDFCVSESITAEVRPFCSWRNVSGSAW